MAKSDKCPFCGSKKIQIKTPYLDRFGEEQFTFCCLPQKKNHGYIDKRYSKLGDEPPSSKEVSKWK